MTTLKTENHANTDFSWVSNRAPRITTRTYKTLSAAVRAAARAQSERVTGEHLITDITDDDGRHYHVSQNGRVWEGWSREQFDEHNHYAPQPERKDLRVVV